jgi:hypothetical protein
MMFKKVKKVTGPKFPGVKAMGEASKFLKE